LVYQINSINSYQFYQFQIFSNFPIFKILLFCPCSCLPLPPPLIVSPYYAMLRGWDLPIQANISVSFNTKLILFNLVIAAIPVPRSELLKTDPPSRQTDLRFQSSVPRAAHRPPAAVTAAEAEKVRFPSF
jgi:hypothetical protein